MRGGIKSGRPIGEQEQAPAACVPYDPRAQEVARKVAGMINHLLPDITVGPCRKHGRSWVRGKGCDRASRLPRPPPRQP
jgi:hypothetical protein